MSNLSSNALMALDNQTYNNSIYFYDFCYFIINKNYLLTSEIEIIHYYLTLHIKLLLSFTM